MQTERYVRLPKADMDGGAGSNNPLDRETCYNKDGF